MRFPPGKYWIGDPCYVFASGWQWSHRTFFGDGFFRDNRGRQYCVDSGQIGIYPAASVADDSLAEGHFTVQKQEFEPTYEDGLFTFGTIRIQT